MTKINENELEKIYGGELSIALCAVVGAAIVFIAGIIDGYVHPKSCNS